MLILATILVLIYFTMPDWFCTAEKARESARGASYFDRMSAADLHARGHAVAGRAAIEWPNAAEYKDWYMSNFMEWSWYEKLWLRVLVGDAERRMCLAGLSVPIWKFAKISPVIEQGYPHTHADVIVWNSSLFRAPYEAQLRLVIHEAVHIWQRAHPEQTRLAHVTRGYQVVRAAPSPLVRNNPDTDIQVWQKNTEYFGSRYRNWQPDGIDDVEGRDHPNELMAYAISRKLTR